MVRQGILAFLEVQPDLVVLGKVSKAVSYFHVSYPASF
jgi:hypothetical protein